MFKVTLAALLIFYSHAALTAPQTLSQVQTYDQLLGAIRQTRAASAERVRVAIEREKVREAWEIGKLIDEYVLQYKERADYGAYVIEKLSKDLGTDRTELYRMLKFARTFPIVVPAQQLSWSHFEALLSLNNPAEVRELAEKAEKEKWTRDRLREEVGRRKARAEPEYKPLEAKLGTLHTYRVVRDFVGEDKDELVIDLGFSNYYRPRKKLKFREGDIVILVKDKLKRSESLKERDLYTFKAEVIRVLDGDTFAASVDLGFGFTTTQTLRLRGLDAPEIKSTEGDEAKAFVEAEFAKVRGKIFLKTIQSDKYDRYLADVWIGDEYLNQTLIDQGLATRVSE